MIDLSCKMLLFLTILVMFTILPIRSMEQIPIPKLGMDEDAIYVLSNETLIQALENKLPMLLLLYSSVMDRNPILTSKFANLTKRLRKIHPQVFYAKIETITYEDATSHFEGISGSQLIYVESKKQYYDFYGEQNEHNLYRWCLKKIRGPTIYLTSIDSAISFVSKRNVSAIGFFETIVSNISKVFQHQANSIDELKFAITDNKNVSEYFGIANNTNTVLVVNKYMNENFTYTIKEITEESKEELFHFFMINKRDLVTEYNESQNEIYVSGNFTHSSYLVIEPTHPIFQATIEEYIKFARKYHSKIICKWMNPFLEKNNDIMGYLGIGSTDEAPTLRIIDKVHLESKFTKYHFKRPQNTSTNQKPLFDHKELINFFEDVMKNKAEAYYISEPRDSEMESKTPPYITAAEFPSIALDKSKAVLIYFWSGWCMLCKFTTEDVLAPLYERLKSEPDILILQTDYLKNEFHLVKNQNFPSLQLFTKGTNEQITFKGKPNETFIETFIRSNGKILPEGGSEEEYTEDMINKVKNQQKEDL